MNFEALFNYALLRANGTTLNEPMQLKLLCIKTISKNRQLLSYLLTYWQNEDFYFDLSHAKQVIASLAKNGNEKIKNFIVTKIDSETPLQSFFIYLSTITSKFYPFSLKGYTHFIIDFDVVLCNTNFMSHLLTYFIAQKYKVSHCLAKFCKVHITRLVIDGFDYNSELFHCIPKRHLKSIEFILNGDEKPFPIRNIEYQNIYCSISRLVNLQNLILPNIPKNVLRNPIVVSAITKLSNIHSLKIENNHIHPLMLKTIITKLQSRIYVLHFTNIVVNSQVLLAMSESSALKNITKLRLDMCLSDVGDPYEPCSNTLIDNLLFFLLNITHSLTEFNLRFNWLDVRQHQMLFEKCYMNFKNIHYIQLAEPDLNDESDFKEIEQKCQNLIGSIRNKTH